MRSSPARQADPLLVQGAHGVRHHDLKRHRPRRNRLRLGHAVRFRPPSPSSTAPPPPGPLSRPGGAPLPSRTRSTASSPGEPLREVDALLMGLVLHVDRGACCKACTVRCLFRKKSAVYHPYFPLFITPCNELVIITKVITRCLVIITKVITRPRNHYEARFSLRIPFS